MQYYKKIKIFLKKYRLVIAGAIVVGLFTVMPWLLFLQRVGDDFRGVWPQYNGDAFFYLARAHEVFDGHPEMNHQYFYEHKDDVYPQAIGLEYFYARLSAWTNLDLPTLQVYMDFISPALLYALFFILLYTVSRQKYPAIIMPLLLFTVAGGVNKPIHPQLSLPLLLIFLIFWVKLIKDDKKKLRNAIIAGVMFGLLFLTYHYHWMLLITLTGIYGFILLLQKKWREIKLQLIMLITALIIGIPYFIQWFKGANVPYYEEMMVRLGMYYSHLPETIPRLIVAIVWLAFFIYFARYYKLVKRPAAQAVGALLIANIIFPNHQIISGVIFQNANHWSGMPLFIYAVALQYIVGIFIAQNRDKSREISAPGKTIDRQAALTHSANLNLIKDQLILIIAILLFIFPLWRLSTFAFQPFLDLYKPGKSENLVRYGAVHTEKLQYYEEIFDWINKFARPDAVILTDERLGSYLTIYTHANVYNTEYAQWLPGSDDEVIERALLAKFFDKEFDINNIHDLIWIQPRQTESNVHTLIDNFGLSWKLDYEPQYSIAKEQKKITEIYNSLKQPGWNVDLLKKYRIDYIIWDKNREAEWNLEKYPELMRIYEKDEIEMYKFKN